MYKHKYLCIRESLWTICIHQNLSTKRQQEKAFLEIDMLKSILFSKDFLKYGIWMAGSTATSQIEAMLENLC